MKGPGQPLNGRARPRRVVDAGAWTQRTPTTPLPALHERDIAAVLGSPLAASWPCGLCGATSSGVPAAYVKRGTGLLPVCFTCLLSADA